MEQLDKYKNGSHVLYQATKVKKKKELTWGAGGTYLPDNDEISKATDTTHTHHRDSPKDK